MKGYIRSSKVLGFDRISTFKYLTGYSNALACSGGVKPLSALYSAIPPGSQDELEGYETRAS